MRKFYRNTNPTNFGLWDQMTDVNILKEVRGIKVYPTLNAVRTRKTKSDHYTMLEGQCIGREFAIPDLHKGFAYAVLITHRHNLDLRRAYNNERSEAEAAAETKLRFTFVSQFTSTNKENKRLPSEAEALRLKMLSPSRTDNMDLVYTCISACPYW